MPDGSHWRPPRTIRFKVIAILRHQDRLLVGEVLGDNGRVKGWCPLGGGVEFGERAEDALRREIREELGCDIAISGPPLLCENLFEHEGQIGHEVVLAWPVELTDPAIYDRERFAIVEDHGQQVWVEWVAIERFRSGREVLFPAALAHHLI